MPQMAPINWLILFFMFCLILFLFNILNYFIFMPSSPETSSKNFKNTFLTWKW
uniref:ATP synthase complex subunit 8 n=1 Tax=Chloronia mirifica TaxID=1569770 RepID=A0A1L2F3Z0_9NEOP|nr:ATP synthase F0 subunit 8 [Chloronia mirifica]ANT70536.1 ATP synthase F0 subunit 8 [Chloronia mirifica]